ncbi:Crossover junction endodeoxyribonuclease RuvC [Syntrophomonas zehnderi OL-4]|uniref:Crossover junction endodeoxyribonuclease RuvC n=1 Tax=Syntrophomonas zehnderi OL-4 TaxID=690567 RepID=A0A0E4GBU8_9FIRM|nr:crossover junction endodeoxyribonuclease RuvC [Syntrophomonas zehnderi]CFX94741.1 Crossover junction endodeoxyribonuclease RuvC [Syntrophomonas zehnderi OL-4]
MLVLGVDPGTATTGYGVVDYIKGKEQLITYGTIRTSADLPMQLRLLKIHQEFNHLLDEYQPEAVAIEELFHHKNAKTVISVAQSRGVLLMATAARGLELAEYTPLQVKQAVSGYGNADKRQVQIMVQKILRMEQVARPDDAADALAIAICHIHSYRMTRLSKGGIKR